MRILHISDPLVDSPVFIRDTVKASRLRAEVRKALTSVSFFLRTDKVDMLLISGGLFDRRFFTRSTAALLLRDIAAAPSVKVIVSPGRTDFFSDTCFYGAYPLPDNLFVFRKPEMTHFDFPELGAVVYGYALDSFERKASPLGENMPALDKSRLNIFLGVGEAGVASSDRGPLTITQIRESGFDYMALGGGSEGNGVERAGKTYYGTPGSLCGHGFSDLGQRGGLLIDLDKDMGRIELRSKGVRFFKKNFEDETVDLSGSKNEEDIRKAVFGRIIEKRFSRETVLRMTLCGVLPQRVLPDTERYRADLEGVLYHVEFRDRTEIGSASLPGLERVLESGSLEERISASVASRLIDGAISTRGHTKKG